MAREAERSDLMAALFRLSSTPSLNHQEKDNEILDTQLLRLLLTDAGSAPLTDEEVSVIPIPRLHLHLHRQPSASTHRHRHAGDGSDLDG